MAAPVPESWTDQRVANLKKLWQQGKSASEIAETLGGVTRNAVIGKAHRLGLSGRPSPIKTATIAKKPAIAAKTPLKSAAPAKKPLVAAKPVAKAPVPVAKPAGKITGSAAKPAAAAPAAPQQAAKSAVPSPNSIPVKTPPFNLPLAAEVMARPLMVHDGKVISILELSEKTCRWPIGDPKDPAFGYCGLGVHLAFPYCPGHVVMAFQSSSRKDTKRYVNNDAKVDEAGVPEDLEVDDIEVEADEELDDAALDDDDADPNADLDV